MLLLNRISFTGIIFFLASSLAIQAQYIPTHVSNTGIYDYLAELTSLQIIELNTAIKPYSHSLILDKLLEASKKQGKFSRRQVKELQFYLKEYSKNSQNPNIQSLTPTFLWINKPQNQRLNLFQYRDTIFNITANPILGSNLWSNQNGTLYHWWNGIETHASYGNFALFASIRDNHESTELTGRELMSQRIGASNIKQFSGGKRDYWEIRGGITYEWNWGHFGLLMDQFSWGDASNGPNIFSGRTPAFARMDLQMNPVDWLQFNYVHGWLISEEVDSTFSFWVNNAYGTEYREVYHPKFLAANMFTFKPIKYFYVGIGNSVIYDYRSPHAAFLIPVMFWKALDHTLNARIDNMNSQVFMTLSSRNLRGVHFYGSAFIDEVQVGRIFRDGEYNFTSVKIGASAYRIPHTALRIEYTWSNALIFRHYVPTTTFESNQYNLGHFLEDNAKDFYAAIEIKPWRTMKVVGYYNESIKGPDHTRMGTMPRAEIDPFDPIVWESTKIGISTSLQIINDLYFRLGYEWRNVSGEQGYIEMWTPEVYWGKTGTLNVGLNYGF